MLDYQRTLLKNGLPLILVPMKNLGSVTVLLGVGSGGRDDPPGKAGLSHFLEHMTFKGTKNRPTPFELAKVIDSVGGEKNGGTTKEFTEYWIKLASEHLEKAFDVLSDLLKNSLFAPREIERERRVIIEEINLYQDMPTQRVFNIFESVVYSKSPLGRELSGSKKTVGRIKRDDLLNYLARFYQPEDMVLVIAGGFKVKEARKLAREYFNDLPGSKAPPRKKLIPKPSGSRLKLVYKRTDQAHFCLGVPGVYYSHPDRFTVSVLASVLGYSRTSRLFQRVRDKEGLAYYIYASPEFYTDAGSFFCQAGTGLDKVGEVVGMVKEEFFRLVKEPVSREELNRAKEYLKGRLILGLEDSFSVASRYALQAVVEGKLRTPQRTLRLIDRVTARDIRRVAQGLFKPEKLHLALIGPYKNAKQFFKLL